MNRLFESCPRLEYLYICESSPNFEATASEIRLPPHLRYLALYDGNHYVQSLLSLANCKAMASSLLGLRLSQQANPGPFAHLKELTNLTYLGIELNAQNGASFLEVGVVAWCLRCGNSQLITRFTVR